MHIQLTNHICLIWEEEKEEMKNKGKFVDLKAYFSRGCGKSSFLSTFLRLVDLEVKFCLGICNQHGRSEASQLTTWILKILVCMTCNLSQF